MVIPEDSLAVGQGALEQRAGLGQARHPPVGDRQVVAAGKCVGMLVPQNARPGGQGALEQRDGLSRAPRGTVGVGEVVVGGQGAGIIGTADPAVIGDERLAKLDRLGVAVAELVEAAHCPAA
ncbi:MAG TPA: hypothetical protein VMV17_10465, partial [Streptosporangiaceae bacterium]|nr:hypothetical protein [Streptosporangiaceae bacterium]